MSREQMPDRRQSWTQRVTISGTTLYLGVGEYEDGRPGEVFLDASKEGTFLRGVLNSLARTISVSLQSGTDLRDITRALRGVYYPPDGRVEGSARVQECCSVADWVAQELEAHYVTDPPMPAKHAGHKREAWRVGA